MSKVTWIRTCLIYFSVFLTSALYFAPAASQLDFIDILDADIKTVSIGVWIRTVAYCIGTLSGAFILLLGDKLTLCAFFLIIASLSNGALSIVKLTHLHYAFNGLLGFGCGVIEPAMLTAISDMWKEKSNSFIQAISFFCAAASLIIPLSISPFTSKSKSSDQSLVNQTNMTITMTDASGEESQIWIPFAFIAASSVSISIFMILLQCITKNEDLKKCKKGWKKELSKSFKEEDERENLKKLYTFLVVCLLCLASLLFSAIFGLFHTFWIVFVGLIDLKIEKHAALIMVSASSASTFLGTIVGVTLSFCLRGSFIYLIITSIMILGSLFLLIFANSSTTMLWIGAMTTTFGFLSFPSTAFNCLVERVQATNFVSSLFMFCNISSGAFGLPIFIGNYIQEQPMVLVYTMLCFSIILFVIGVALLLIDSIKPITQKEINHKKLSIKLNFFELSENHQ
ncbi:sodium-dependent glucose transporter 1-like protein, partial [Dinothrombium tinctorium]